MIKLKSLLTETTVRLSTMKDASFEPGEFVQILGKKGKVKLDKKSVKFLAKWIRSNSGKHGMGWSFTEGKLTEATDSYVVWSPLLNKVYDGPVSEKEALKLVKKYSKQGQYHVGMQGTKYYNKTKLGKKNPIKEGFDLKKLEIVIKSIQKKIAKQGRVTNARDEDHLKQLIKVYKQMGGRKIREAK